VLLEVMYDLPSRGDVKQCIVDRATVLEKVHPTLVTDDDGQTELKSA
jgi:ATP-dependent protease Clp ATPase subunit